MMQAESLLKDYNDVRAPVARRLDLFFASGMRPIWTLEEKWANVMFNLGFVKRALDVFIKLGLWEDVIVCYNLLNQKHKVHIFYIEYDTTKNYIINHLCERFQAAEIIKQEISKKPTVKLWCLLGDATGDVSHYEVAWRLSEKRSSRVQKHWGFYYFEKKNVSI